MSCGYTYLSIELCMQWVPERKAAYILPCTFMSSGIIVLSVTFLYFMFNKQH